MHLFNSESHARSLSGNTGVRYKHVDGKVLPKDETVQLIISTVSPSTYLSESKSVEVMEKSSHKNLQSDLVNHLGETNDCEVFCSQKVTRQLPTETGFTSSETPPVISSNSQVHTSPISEPVLDNSVEVYQPYICNTSSSEPVCISSPFSYGTPVAVNQRIVETNEEYIEVINHRHEADSGDCNERIEAKPQLDCQKLKSLMRSVLRPEAKLKAKLSSEKRSDVTEQLFESEGVHCEETAATVGSEQVSVFGTFRLWYLLSKDRYTGTPQHSAVNQIWGLFFEVILNQNLKNEIFCLFLNSLTIYGTGTVVPTCTC
jgi:hypothetical protein